jgi:heat shock protein HslJ
MFRSVLTGIVISLCIVISGCAGTKSVANSMALSGAWQVESIDQGGIIDNSMITMQFDKQNRLSGFTGCNRYASTVSTQGGGFTVLNAITTRRACAPAMMMQEQRFLAALNDVTHFEVMSDTWLVMSDKSNNERLKLIEVNEALHTKHLKVDSGNIRSSTFECEALGAIKVRFVGPETIEILMGSESTLLQRLRSASGTQYDNDTMHFWNKANEALMRIDEQQYLCIAL